MKNVFYFVMLLSIFFSVEANAQNGNGNGNGNGKKKTVLTPIVGNTNNPTGQNEWPTVVAEYDNEELTISVTNFSGNASISIYRTLGHIFVYNDTIYLSDINPVDIDISSLTSGTYTLVIMLDSGELFNGNFELEDF